MESRLRNSKDLGNSKDNGFKEQDKGRGHKKYTRLHRTSMSSYCTGSEVFILGDTSSQKVMEHDKMMSKGDM